MREKTTRGIADRKGEFLWYLGGTLLSLLFLGFALRLWEYDLRVPFGIQMVTTCKMSFLQNG